MPKRTRVELIDVAAWPNLAAAFWRAASGKRDRVEVRAFEARLDPELRDLQRGILDLTVAVGHFHSFEIRDPKIRSIHAPVFRERVLHHALMAQIGPPLDRSLGSNTFACRTGFGTHAAVRAAQRHARCHPWYLQIDIRAYFASIGHAMLEEMLSRRLKGRGVLALCSRILGGYETAPGRGLPIGALTSQHFANLYLDRVDRLLAAHPDVAASVRYMDDIVWWSASRVAARGVLCEVDRVVCAELGLEIKSSWRLQQSGRGLTFCGFRVLPDQVRLSARRRRRYRAARQRWEQAFSAAVIDSTQLQAGYAAALAVTQGAEARAWRRAELSRRPPLDA